MAEENLRNPLPPLLYATPVQKRRRRWRTLRPSLAMATIVCGTILAITPSVLAGLTILSRSGYVGFSSDVMAIFWATAIAGAVIILIGVFFSAPHERRRKKVPNYEGLLQSRHATLDS